MLLVWHLLLITGHGRSAAAVCLSSVSVCKRMVVTSDPENLTHPAATELTGAAVLTADPIRVDELHAREDSFRKRFPVLWASTLYGPFLVTLLAVAGLYLYAGGEFTRKLLVSTLLSLYLLGRFVILNGSEGRLMDVGGDLSSEHLFLLVTWLDVMTALVLAFHIGFLFRLPFVGSRIAALVTDGHFILDAHPWIRRATFLGLISFVMFPLTATGAVGGSIFGRLLGMSRRDTFVGIVVGSLLGNGIMYVFSESLARWLDKDHPVIKYGGFVLIALIAVILERRYRQLREQFSSGSPR